MDPGAEFTNGPEVRRRFRDAVSRKHDVMAKAGEAGYQTHLVVGHWLLGRTESWIDELVEGAADARPHPQYIWAVDMKWLDQRPVQLIWPLVDQLIKKGAPLD